MEDLKLISDEELSKVSGGTANSEIIVGKWYANSNPIDILGEYQDIPYYLCKSATGKGTYIFGEYIRRTYAEGRKEELIYMGDFEYDGSDYVLAPKVF